MSHRWDELLDGLPHVYRRGRDFSVPAQEFAELVRATAEQFGLVATVRVDGNFVAFQSARPQPVLTPETSSGFEAHLDQAVALRRGGATYAYIAEKFGVSPATAARHVRRALEQAAGAP
jgi:hypothetical protein